MSDIPSRLSLVTLGARDVARLRDFYVALGWPLRNDVEGEFASFLLGGVVLALYRADLLAAEAAPGAPDPGDWRGVTLACNCDSRAELDRAFAAAIAAGGTLVMAPVDREWGGASGYFADPEGNRWEVAYAPGMSFDERGAVTAF